MKYEETVSEGSTQPKDQLDNTTKWMKNMTWPSTERARLKRKKLAKTIEKPVFLSTLKLFSLYDNSSIKKQQIKNYLKITPPLM